MRTDEEPRFSERSYPPTPYFLVLAAIAAAQAVVLGAVVRAGPGPASPAASPVALALGVVAGVLLPLLLMTVHTAVAVTDEGLWLALPPFWRRTVPLERITSVAVRDVSPLRDAGGYGLRFGGGGRVALVMRRGAAVEVRTVTGERYLVGTRQPEQLVRALSE
jgi:hypothetical protein